MEIESWLTSLGLGQYAQQFNANDIDLQLAPSLTTSDLIELGVNSIGHRRKILSAAQELGKSHTQQPAEEELGERRQLTVLFCDLVGSTDFSQSNDPEDVQALLSAYHDVCQNVVTQHGGRIANFMGDGAVAVFGYPSAKKDDAARAIDAGLALVEATRNLILPNGMAPKSRIGIDSGLVVVGGAGAETSLGNISIFGEIPNRAARIQSLAVPNTVWVHDSVLTLSRHSFHVTDCGQHPLKGFTAPQQLWQVKERKTARAQANSAQTPLVGRDTEVEQVKLAWAGVCQKQVRKIHIRGEIGIGKSHLLDVAIAALEPKPIAHLACTGTSERANTAYGVLFRLIRQQAGATELADTENLADRLRAYFGHQADDGQFFTHLVSLMDGSSISDGAIKPMAFRNWLITRLKEKLTALGTRGAIVISIDDAELCDPTSAEIFSELAEAMPSTPLLLITAGQNDLPTSATASQIITLPHLADDDIRTILLTLLRDKNASDDLIEAIVQRAEGVVVFAIEFARLSAIAPTQSGEISVPATLQEVLLARIDALGSSKFVALAAACIGRDFSRAVLSEILKIDQVDLTNALGAMEQAAIIRKIGDGVFSFGHGLVRKMAYDMQLRKTKHITHAKIAPILDADPATHDTEMVARHFELAHMHREAAFKWQIVAERQISLGGYREAIAALDQARQCLRELAEAPELHRLELKILSAYGASLIAIRPQASEDIKLIYEQARRLCKKLAPTVDTVPILFGLAVQSFFRGELTKTQQFCEELASLHDALDLSPVERSGAHLMQTQTQFWRGQHDRVLQTMAGLEPNDPRQLRWTNEDQKKQIARFAQVPSVTARITYVWSLNLTGRLSQATEQLIAVRAHAEQLGHPYSIAQTCQIAAWHYCVREDLAECLEWAGRLKDMATQHGLAMFHDIADILMFWAKGRLGQCPQAAEHIDEIAARMFHTGAQLAVGTIATLIADCALRSGAIDIGHRALDRALLHTYSEEQLYRPELLRMRAGLNHYQDPDNPLVADDLNRAILCAQEQGATLLALRAATQFAAIQSAADERAQAASLVSKCLAEVHEPTDIFLIRTAKSISAQDHGATLSKGK